MCLKTDRERQRWAKQSIMLITFQFILLHINIDWKQVTQVTKSQAILSTLRVNRDPGFATLQTAYCHIIHCLCDADVHQTSNFILYRFIAIASTEKKNTKIFDSKL